MRSSRVHALSINQKTYFCLGFHAVTSEEFAGALQTVLTLSHDDESYMRWRARAWAVQRFSEEEFEKGWNQSGWRTWLY